MKGDLLISRGVCYQYHFESAAKDFMKSLPLSGAFYFHSLNCQRSQKREGGAQAIKAPWLTLQPISTLSKKHFNGFFIDKNGFQTLRSFGNYKWILLTSKKILSLTLRLGLTQREKRQVRFQRSYNNELLASRSSQNYLKTWHSELPTIAN